MYVTWRAAAAVFNSAETWVGKRGVLRKLPKTGWASNNAAAFYFAHPFSYGSVHRGDEPCKNLVVTFLI